MKGQVATEYVILLTTLLAALTPFVYLAYQGTEAANTIARAEEAVNTIVSAADSVAASGPGTTTIVDVFIPGGYSATESYIFGKLISLRFYLSTGASLNIQKIANSNLTGTLPSNWGYHRFIVKMEQNGTVSITTPT